VAGPGTWQRLEAAAASGQHRELIDTSPMYGDAERLLADPLGATTRRTTGNLPAPTRHNTPDAC
jgi:hypothetical protein